MVTDGGTRGLRSISDTRPSVVREGRLRREAAGEAGNGREALAAASHLAPDVILMHIRMPHMDGVEATRQIIESDNQGGVIVLTTFDLDEYVYAALRAGASGFLLKDVPPNDLLSAIRAVAHLQS